MTDRGFNDCVYYAPGAYSGGAAITVTNFWHWRITRCQDGVRWRVSSPKGKSMEGIVPTWHGARSMAGKARKRMGYPAAKP
jgi:hypothetical protein